MVGHAACDARGERKFADRPRDLRDDASSIDGRDAPAGAMS